MDSLSPLGVLLGMVGVIVGQMLARSLNPARRLRVKLDRALQLRDDACEMVWRARRQRDEAISGARKFRLDVEQYASDLEELPEGEALNTDEVAHDLRLMLAASEEA